MPESQLLPSVMLPKWESLFVARTTELELVLQRFERDAELNSPPILAFCGVSGVGKTALCAEALARLQIQSTRQLGLCHLDLDLPRYHPGYPLFELFGQLLYPALRKAGFRCPLFLVMYTAWVARLEERSAISPSNFLQDLAEQGKESSELLKEKDELFKSDWIELFGEAAEGLGAAKLLLKALAYLKTSRAKGRFADRFADVDLASMSPSALDELAPKAMAADLIDQIEKQACYLTLIIDGLERVQTDTLDRGAEWAIQQLMANLLLSPAAKQVQGIVFSRTPLTWSRFDPKGTPDGWDRLIEYRDLPGLSKEDAQLFLTKIEVWYEQTKHYDGASIAQILRAHRSELLQACQEASDSASFHALAITVAVEQVARHHKAFSPELLGQNAVDMYSRFVRGLNTIERGLLEVFSIFGEVSEVEFTAALQVGLLPGVGANQFDRIVRERQYCISPVSASYHRVHTQMVRAMHSWCMGNDGRRRSYFRACTLLLKNLLITTAKISQTSFARAERFLQSYLVVARSFELAREECNQAWFQALEDLDMNVPVWLGLELRSTAYLRHALANVEAAKDGDERAQSHYLAALTRAAELIFAIGDYESCISTVQHALDVIGEPNPDNSGVRWATLKLHEAVSLVRTSRVPEGEAILTHLAATSDSWFRLSVEGVRTVGKLAGSLGEFFPERGLTFIDFLVEKHGQACKEQFGFELRQFFATVEAALSLKIHNLSRAAAALELLLVVSDAPDSALDPLSEGKIVILRAQVAFEQGNCDVAIDLAHRAVRLVNGIEGAREQSKSQILADAGTILRDANANEDWLQLLRQSLSLYEVSDGPESHMSVPVRTALAHGLIAKSEFTEGVALLRKNLSIIERDFGQDHREVIPAVINLANAVMSSGEDPNEATQLFQRAMTIMSSSPVTSTFDRGVVLANWGAHALECFKFDEAQINLEKAISLLRAIPGYVEGHLPKALYNLSGILQMKGETVRALQLLDEARAFLKLYKGDDAEDLSMINDLTLAIIEGRTLRPSRSG